jgi:hypothetical protein
MASMDNDVAWWCDEAVDAIPASKDKPISLLEIQARFTEPRPSIAWIKKYLREEMKYGFVQATSLGGFGKGWGGVWLRYRWTPLFDYEFGGVPYENQSSGAATRIV